MIEDIISEIFLEFEVELDKAVDYLKTEYQIMRAGRANPHVLDKIMINYYDTMTPINQLANISVQDARMIVISVWDTAIVKDITKAIATSDIGINPSDDGKIIRMVFPSLTQERRVEMTKVLKKLAEDAKITCRNARRDCLEELKKLKKNSEISEDMYASLEKDVQKTLDPYIEKIDRMQSEKEKEIMQV